jgi:hypothetical protein
VDGIYNLDYLEKQEYFIRFTPPTGYSVTLPRVTNDERDSDVDHSFGPNTTRSFDMQSGQVYEHIDMGLAYGVLPLDWLDVTVVRDNDKHKVSWSTAKEVNVSHYVVERKLENETEFYSVTGPITAIGDLSKISNYSIFDEDVLFTGTYVYRVRQIDFDGKFSYSKLVKINHQSDKVIEMFPNPANSSTEIVFSLLEDSEVSIEIFDATFKLVEVIQTKKRLNSGQHSYFMNLNNCSPGVYSVLIKTNEKITQKKLIIIK